MTKRFWVGLLALAAAALFTLSAESQPPEGGGKDKGQRGGPRGGPGRFELGRILPAIHEGPAQPDNRPGETNRRLGKGRQSQAHEDSDREPATATARHAAASGRPRRTRRPGRKRRTAARRPRRAAAPRQGGRPAGPRRPAAAAPTAAGRGSVVMVFAFAACGLAREEIAKPQAAYRETAMKRTLVAFVAAATINLAASADSPVELVKNPRFTGRSADRKSPAHYTLTGDAAWAYCGFGNEASDWGVALHSALPRQARRLSVPRRDRLRGRRRQVVPLLDPRAGREELRRRARVGCF